MNPLRGRSAGRPLAESILTGLVAQTIVMVSGVLVARALGATDRGHLALLILIPTGITAIGTLGVPLSVTFAVSRKPHLAKTIAEAVVFPGTVQALALLAIYSVILSIMLAGQRSDVVAAGLVTIMIIPVVLIQQYGLAFLQGQQRFRYFNALRLLPPALYSAAVIGLVVFGGGNLLQVTIAWLACYLVGTITTVVVVISGLPLSTDGEAPPTRRQMLTFGMSGLLGSTSPVERFRVDQAVVGFLLSPTALGMYVVGMAFTNLITFIGQGIGIVAYPRVAAMPYVRARRSALWRYVILTVGVCGAVLLALEAASGWLVPTFFGMEFVDAVPVTRILLVAAFLLAIRRVLAELARGAGKPSTGSIAEVASWVSLLPALAILTPLWGLYGVAWSVAISAGASLCIVALLVARQRARSLPEGTSVDREHAAAQ